jgi:hypothetical protein
MADFAGVVQGGDEGVVTAESLRSTCTGLLLYSNPVRVARLASVLLLWEGFPTTEKCQS